MLCVAHPSDVRPLPPALPAGAAPRPRPAARGLAGRLVHGAGAPAMVDDRTAGAPAAGPPRPPMQRLLLLLLLLPLPGALGYGGHPVAPGGVAPYSGGGARRGGGWGYVRDPAEGFFIAGSSIKAMNGVYKKVERVPAAIPHKFHYAYRQWPHGTEDQMRGCAQAACCCLLHGRQPEPSRLSGACRTAARQCSLPVPLRRHAVGVAPQGRWRW
eukprot:COSAG01_NODE_389_length_17708_cov_111.404452_3_plen_213_part_00